MTDDKKQQSPWGIDRLKEQTKGISDEQQKALHEECVLYAQCFSTEAGRKVLQILDNILEGRPTFDPSLDAKYGFYKEGQNDIIRHIKNRINFARRK